jgi:hypothetical protein
MAKIMAHRRIALGAPGAKSGTDFTGMFSDGELVALQDALAAIGTLQETNPDYFEEQTDGHDPSHPIATVLAAAEGVWPGSVQSHLGWTRISYFHGKQFGYAPNLHEKIPRAVLHSVYACKLRGLPLFKSAFVIGFAQSMERLSIWLLEEDLRYTQNIGAAGIIGTLLIASDGSYQFTPQGEDAEDAEDAEPQGEPVGFGNDFTPIPWGGLAFAFALLVVIVGCVRQMG